jgi:hypothetical protein
MNKNEDLDLDEDDEEEGVEIVAPINIQEAGNKRFRRVTPVIGRGASMDRVLAPSRPPPVLDPLPDPQYLALTPDRREKFIGSDPLLKRVDDKSDSTAVLREVRREIAREAAALYFDRVEAEKKGRDASSISTRRIDALRRVADIELRIRELDQDSIDLGSEKMQLVFKLWVETMREVAVDVLPPESVDLFFNRFATAMESWEEKAQSVLR